MLIHTTKRGGFPVHQKIPQFALISGFFGGCDGGGAGLTKTLQYKLLLSLPLFLWYILIIVTSAGYHLKQGWRAHMIRGDIVCLLPCRFKKVFLKKGFDQKSLSPNTFTFKVSIATLFRGGQFCKRQGKIKTMIRFVSYARQSCLN